MGVYGVSCTSCGKHFLWFSGSADQRCSSCSSETKQSPGGRIQVGDKVRCLSNEETCHLQEGGVYTVKKISYKNRRKYLHLNGISEPPWEHICYETTRFKKVKT